MNKALIIVDVQNDFVTGSLAVPWAREIIPIISWIVKNANYKLKVATLDWHPENHISFKQWPKHCVQNSAGSSLALDHDLLTTDLRLVFKGTDINVDSYSGFFDNNHEHATLLETKIKTDFTIDELDIVGIATDYCVKFTALDAIKLGYKVNVLSFACRGVTPETTEVAIEEMKSCNINVL